MKHFVLKGAEADLVTVENVPIMKTGTFKLAVGGEQVFTEEDLLAAANAPVNDSSVKLPRQGVGHDSTLNDGEPAMGTYENLRVTATAHGHTLYGDLKGVPRWFAKIMPSAYPNRSIEGERNYVSAAGVTHRLAITAVKCLGIVLPGISTLEDLRHMYGTEMPEGTQLLASFSDPKGKVIIADTADDEIELPEEKVRQVDPKALRMQLGLAETATDAEVDSTLAAMKTVSDKVAADTAAADKAAADQAAAEKAAAKAAADAAKNIPDGMALIDTSVLEELKVAAARANALHASAEASTITTEVNKAISEGKFAPARREHFVKACEADREGTFALMASMASGLVPVTKELGTSGEEGLKADEAAYDPSMISVGQRDLVAAATEKKGNHLVLVPGQIYTDKVG